LKVSCTSFDAGNQSKFIPFSEICYSDFQSPPRGVLTESNPFFSFAALSFSKVQPRLFSGLFHQPAFHPPPPLENFPPSTLLCTPCPHSRPPAPVLRDLTFPSPGGLQLAVLGHCPPPTGPLSQIAYFFPPKRLKEHSQNRTHLQAAAISFFWTSVNPHKTFVFSP